VSAHRFAHGQTRAPIELANDPTLVRYRVAVISDRAELIAPASVDLPEVFGTVPGHLTSGLSPVAFRPGALARAGNGIILFDARELLANYASWPRLKQAFRRGTANPLEVFGLEIPFDACLVITGDADDYTAWCALDSDVPRLVRHIKAYPQTIPLTPTSTNDFNNLISAIVRDEALLPLEATAMTALLNANTTTQNRVPILSFDLDALPDLLTEASRIAEFHSRATVTAHDVRDALQLISHST
jgi:predicted ATP-dependent protease